MKGTDVERLIESAYSGLGPSPAVEEMVRAALPAERARPARRGRLVLAAVLALAAVAAALARPRGGGLADGDDGPELPVVARPPSGVALELGEEKVRVRLTRDGRILVPAGEKWQQVTLAELGPYLKRAAEAFHDRETAAGRSGYEELPLGYKASLLRVDLVADRDAPWQHVQWIMTVCAEQAISRLAFAVRDFALDAGLPVDRGLREAGRRERPHVKVTITIRAGGRTRYAFGGEETEELASVARHLAAAKEAGGDEPVIGEVKAGRSVPYHEVAKVLAEFRQAGYDRVEFYGTKLPGDDVRQAAQLPKPESEWGGGGGGKPGAEKPVEEAKPSGR